MVIGNKQERLKAMDSERICPHCTNNTTLKKRDLINYNGKRVYIRDEKAYYEDDGKVIHLVGFYFCPFCGRQFEDSRIGHRKFRGE